MDLKKSELAKQILSSCYIKGDFLLRSGQRSTEYFDKYLLEADPKILEKVAEFLIPLLPKETEVLAGLEMGGIPIGTALSLKSNLPLRFVRKKAKDYGTMNICEGGPIKGKKLCIIEDVVSTGGQIIESTRHLRSEGAIVSDGLCVIFRGEDLTALEKENFKLHYLFSKKELLNSKG